ncbi:MAG: hypothetical protein HUU50_22345, partial [Candidatus Brocadiae bacterium]|nr:hypothetical protein [Candidatus Brocadiia bacterium]
YLQIADLEEKVLELKETSSPKARDFQEQEAKIKKLNKENQDIYNEFNKMRDEYHSEKKRNMFLAAQVQLFKEDLARIKKDYGIEE